MPEDTSFADLMTRLRSGDDQAAAQVFHRFAQRLIALARTRLSQSVRPKMDPEDVLQSVFRSFFARHAGGEVEVENWDSLWGLLVVITMRKCGRQGVYFHAARRDVAREVAPRAAPDESSARWEAEADEPTPSEAAMLTETVEQLMQSLDARQRQILALSLQGCPPAEISEQVGCTERTVYRVLERVKEWLQRQRDGDG